MKEITYYEAEDGTRFTNKNDCQEYESKSHEDFKKIKTLSYYLTETEDWDRIYYYHIPADIDAEAAAEFIEESTGYVIPAETGNFGWDDNTEEWIDLDERIEELEEETERYKKVLKILNALED